MNASEFDDVMVEFITESRENLDELDTALVTLEQHPDPGVIAKIFRSIHTVKGTSGFLGLRTLESVTHIGENLLSKMRDGDLPVTQANTSALLSMVDAVRSILDHIESSGTEGDETYGPLIEELSRLNNGEAAFTAPAATEAPAETPAETPAQAAPAPAAKRSRKKAAATEVVTQLDPPAPTADEAAAASRRRGKDASVTALKPRRVKAAPPAKKAEPAPAPEPAKFGDQLLEAGLITETQLDDALTQQHEGDPRHVGEILVEREAIKPADVVETLKVQSEERPIANESIRVDVGLLDDLMNLVGELVLARNQILQFNTNFFDPAFSATSQRLNLITSELQEGVMKTRMQPIDNIWNKFPRIVRDLSLSCGKNARLEMEGKHTEVDKTLLEAIKDPLTHLIRNAIDHGLETPEVRMATGKPAEGTVRLSAYHEGGQVIIEIADDGAGIDANVIRRKAVQKGLLTADDAAARPDRDIVNVIFQPGFSTAETVSNISGRGVGMDVVKTNIESIGGTVDVQTAIGRGTTFKVKIPLTLAIIPALLVRAGGERYAIPQVSLVELVRLDGESATSGIESVQGAPVHRLRGKLLPLVFLNDVFGTTPQPIDDAVNIVVVQSDDTQFGLVVDDISDTAEIVVKPLGRLLKGASGFAGATIMGDGKVALILDLLGVSQLAGVSNTSAARAQAEANAARSTESSSERESILIVGIGERRFALPLAHVTRLEELPVAAVRTAGDHRVIHYRDVILPLVALADRLGIYAQPADAEHLQVLVCGAGDHSVGLIVDSVFDIVDERLEYSDRTETFGVMGTTVIGGEVTDVLDIRAFVTHDVLAAAEVAA
ncbi:MAG: chemotaxis protein CheW [Acidimicrobiales bacterium]